MSGGGGRERERGGDGEKQRGSETDGVVRGERAREGERGGGGWSEWGWVGEKGVSRTETAVCCKAKRLKALGT